MSELKISEIINQESFQNEYKLSPRWDNPKLDKYHVKEINSALIAYFKSIQDLPNAIEISDHEKKFRLNESLKAILKVPKLCSLEKYNKKYKPIQPIRPPWQNYLSGFSQISITEDISFILYLVLASQAS